MDDLKRTLDTLKTEFDSGLKCIICDDCSFDGTSEFIKSNFPNIHLVRNDSNKGLIYSRNLLFDLVTTEFAIFLDDDANFLIKPNYTNLGSHFDEKLRCAVLGFRIFWGLNQPNKIDSNEETQRMRSFVGCGHVWRMSAWNEIPEYPEWYKFYGEEDFASFHLFKRNWEIHYYPDILVHHRVHVKSRKKDKDYIDRTRRALHAGWSNYLIFHPMKLISRKLGSSIWSQMTNKVFKGDLKAFLGLILAIYDLIVNFTKIKGGIQRLTMDEFRNYNRLKETKIYWRCF